MEINAVSTVMDEYDLADLNFSKIEKTLNVCSYVPIIGQVSGFVRGLLGTVQLVCGFATGTFLRLQSLQKEDKKEYLDKAWKHEVIAMHGAANILRACIETSMFVHYLVPNWFDYEVRTLMNPAFFKMALTGIITGIYDVSGYRLSYNGELKDKNIQKIQVK